MSSQVMLPMPDGIEKLARAVDDFQKRYNTYYFNL